MANDRGALGSAGEDAAARWYEERGYRILARNWRCRIGELDLVAARDDLLVICEVKTRAGAGFGGGYEAVTAKKQAKIRAVAEAFLGSIAVEPNSIRFDVASAETGSRGRVVVELFEDAF
ncbi:MAG TPA: YraN family protein [Actinomycetota bacterium]|nr:YraN family protein [Actinomycetota bacterium]